MTPSRLRKPRPGEWKLEIKLVDAALDRQRRHRQRARLAIDAAPSDVQYLRLVREGKRMRPVDHRYALRRPALPSAPDKKSFSSASSPIFAWRTFKSTGAAPSAFAAFPPETTAAPSSNCPFQFVIRFAWTSRLSKLAQRLLALDPRQGHLRLEGRSVVPSPPSCHDRPWYSATTGQCQEEYPLIGPSRFTGPPLWIMAHLDADMMGPSAIRSMGAP